MERVGVSSPPLLLLPLLLGKDVLAVDCDVDCGPNVCVVDPDVVGGDDVEVGNVLTSVEAASVVVEAVGVVDVDSNTVVLGVGVVVAVAVAGVVVVVATVVVVVCVVGVIVVGWLDV